jgi:hypothetical protein
MKKIKSIVVITIILTTFIFVSCNKTTKTLEKEKTLIEKENELLKRENNLLKKEQEIDKKLTSNNETQQTSKLSFLKDFNEKYPYDVKLLENPTLKKRLKKMIGSRYDFLKSIWEVEVPIEIKDGIFFSNAMQAHSGGNPGATIVVDLKTDVLYVGIKENDDIKIYSEDGSKSPQCLVDWSNGDY